MRFQVSIFILLVHCCYGVYLILFILQVNINVEDNEGRYPMHLAAGYSSPAIVKVSLCTVTIENCGKIYTTILCKNQVNGMALCLQFPQFLQKTGNEYMK